MKKILDHRSALLAAVALGALAVAIAFPSSSGSTAEASHETPPNAGEPLAGLSPQLQALFLAGRDVWTHEFTPSEGLGPLYNETSCQTCHGGIGGVVGGPDPNGVGSQFNVEHFGLDQDGLYNALRPFGGPVRQRQSIQGAVPSCPLAGETVPAFANVRSTRHTPAVWGFGLLDAIPDATILARQSLGVDGVKGFANWGREPQARESTPLPATPELAIFGPPRVGRFGWKSQTATLEQFSADPFNIELGISNVFFPQERTPTGLVDGSALPAGCDVADSQPNDEDQSLSFALYHFQALLAPPPPAEPTRESVAGRLLFEGIGCANCHVPSMQTGSEYWMETDEGVAVRVPQLENVRVEAWTDLLVHDMGPALADNGGTTIGRTMGRARGEHWRTTPLWGLRFKQAFLHDGRTADLREAVLLHGGEAQRSRDRFDSLPRPHQDRILAFLRSL